MNVKNYEAGDKQTDLYQAKTEGTEYHAKAKGGDTRLPNLRTNPAKERKDTLENKEDDKRGQGQANTNGTNRKVKRAIAQLKYPKRHKLITTLEATNNHKEYSGHISQTRDLIAVQLVTLARVDYLLADPRLAEAPNFRTVVPLTGSTRYTPKPPPISDLLPSQHQSNNQPKDAKNKPQLGGLYVKTRLANLVNDLPRTLVLGYVKTVYVLHVYLLADPRLAEAIDYSTVVPLTGLVCSAPKPLPSSNQPHSQHLNDDIVNKPIVNNRITIFVFKHGHLLNDQPKGKHKGEGELCRYEYEGGEAGGVGRRTSRTHTRPGPNRPTSSKPRPRSPSMTLGPSRLPTSRTRPRTPRTRPGPSSPTTSRTRPRTPSTRSRTRRGIGNYEAGLSRATSSRLRPRTQSTRPEKADQYL